MAGEEVIIAGIVLVVVAFVLMGVVIARRYIKVPPDQAMIVYGRRRGDRGYIVLTGGAKFIAPIVESVRFMNIGTQMSIIRVVDVITRSGVPLTVDCVAVYKISAEREKLYAAAGQWLSKNVEEMKTVAEEIIAGEMRGTCATLEVEQINSDRDALSSAVWTAVTPHFAKLGLELLSVTIKDIADEVGYLEALGKRRTAEVKRDAIVAEATARKQAIALAAEQDVESQKIRFKADAEIAAAQAERDAAIEASKKDATTRYARAK